MVKKILMTSLVLAMMISITSCSTQDKSTKEEENTTTTTNTNKPSQDRPFTESKGLIKYFTIDNEKIPLPETVGEYVKYLEKVGTRIELGDTGKTVDEVKLNAGGISSMVAYLKVYIDDAADEWQWFGIRYVNDTNKKIPVSECKVTQISLDYDTITEEENHHGINSIVFITRDNEEIAMDGKTTSHKHLFKMLGYPEQNTDGHLHYSDDQGYKYEMVTENKKGILTKFVITYPNN